MAEVVRCEKGHFYDKSVFVKCPHCEANETRDTKNTGYRNEVSKFALEYLQEKQGQGSSRQEQRPPMRQEDPVTEAGRRRHNVSEAAAPDRNLSDERTIAQSRGRAAAEKDGKTVGFSASNQKNYLVTGWLVCVEGPNLGYSFNLYYGYNTIGYSRSNQVCLLEDISVARKVHCSVIYEDRKNKFYLVPEKDQPTFLNDERVEGMGELQTGDLIKLGKTTLEFIAFCRGERKWDRKELQKAAARF